MVKKLIFLLIVFCSGFGSAQTYVLSGTISGNNETLPFATILVKGTTLGTNSNANGQYRLKLPAGDYEIIFQYIGFTKKIERVSLNSDKTLNVVLSSDGISLKEVEVTAGEDPAYAIIRQAIKKRKYYLNQLDVYTCKAYIKGLQKINKIPKNLKGLLKISGGEISDTAEMKGVVYLSESESKYHFRKPGDEKEIMYSSKVSGDNKSFSFNQLSDMKINFYNNLVELGNISDRPFTSPIHENALFFYKYYLLGTITSEGKTINKIKVVPKRQSDPCFAGIIYIQDSTWRITSADMILTKDAKIDFVDTLYIKQLHSSVMGDSIWMPITLNLSFDFKAFGFKGNGYFNANIKEYDLRPVYPKRFFKNELLKVEDDANKKDSIYWNANRAVPLTPEEAKDYREKDSIARIRSTDRFKDSVDKKNNKFKFNDIFFGYNYQNTKKRLNISFPGIVTNGVQYNTVEGLNLSYYFGVYKSFANYTSFNISGRSRYGFSNKLWGGELEFQYAFKPEKSSRVGLKIKSLVEQFNPQDPISPLVNSVYSLLINENYMKLFKETGLETNYNTELFNGVYLSSVLRYMQRDPLKNTSDILFIDDKNKLFTSNDPLNPNNDEPSFTSNTALTFEIGFSFRFKQKYYTMPHQKIVSGSKYPRLNVTYKKAIPVLNANANYDLVTATVSDEVKLGLFGRFSYRLKAGDFLTAKKLYFMDFKHFWGNQTIINSNDYLGSFRLLPYYGFSTDNWFTEAHAEHHFNGLIMNKLPLIKKLNLQEVVGGHFLATQNLKYYYEINFGLEKIFKFFRVDYVLGYAPNSKLKQGVTVGLNMSF